MIYAKEINGVVKEIKLPNRYNGIENVQNGYATRVDLHELDGFIELVRPIINSATEKYGDIFLENGSYYYNIITFTTEEIVTKEYNKNKVARIKEMHLPFDVRTGLVATIATESEKVYNEFNGLKEFTKYVNGDDLVAIKTFSIFNENGNRGTTINIDYYDNNNEVIESTSKSDYYSAQKIKAYKGKCTIRVYQRLLWDIDEELIQLNMIVDYYTDAQKTAILPAFGLSTIAELNAMPTYMTNLFDITFKVNLKEEVDIMYKTGDSTALYVEINDTSKNLDLDQIAATSTVGNTYRQILLLKFNPENFNFYG